MHEIKDFSSSVDDDLIEIPSSYNKLSLSLEDSQRLQHSIFNVPVAFLNKVENTDMIETCVRIPHIFDIKFNNIYWQTLVTDEGTLQLFGAYFDNRAANFLGPTVRIVGMMDKIRPQVIIYCQIWFGDRKEPVIVKMIEYRLIWKTYWEGVIQDEYLPYLMSCPLPPKYKDAVPTAISLTKKPCGKPNNILRVIYNKAPTKKDFLMCMPTLNFPDRDLAVKLTEWIELMLILGVDKIIFYELNVHPNMQKVFKYYQERGQVEIIPMTLAGGDPNASRLRTLYFERNFVREYLYNTLVLNDCFYKNMYQYNYIVLSDIDEVIMPTNKTNWKELLEKTIIPKAKYRGPIASFFATSVYFLTDMTKPENFEKDIPEYMHMLQHVYRSKKFHERGEYVKGFHNTELVLTLHNHLALTCLGTDDSCNNYAMSITDAKVHHYRWHCVRELRHVCETEYKAHTVADRVIWRYKEELTKKVNKTVTDLMIWEETGNNKQVV